MQVSRAAGSVRASGAGHGRHALPDPLKSLLRDALATKSGGRKKKTRSHVRRERTPPFVELATDQW